MKLFAVIVMAILLGAESPPAATKSTKSDEAVCASSEAVDLTEASLKARLANAKSWTKTGSLIVERPARGLKISRQRYQVLDQDSLLLTVTMQCVGTCDGGTGCGVSGCDPVSGGCNRITCTEGEGCKSSCAKVSTQ